METLNTTLIWTRQHDTLNPSQLSKTISIVGCGSVGSWTALALARMGLSQIDLYDFDTVSVENLNCQNFDIKDLDQPKVFALSARIERAVGFPLRCFNQKVDKNQLIMSNIVVMATDTLESRQDICHAARGAELLIDCRMSILETSITACKPKDYQIDINEVTTPEPCSNKNICFTPMISAGLISNIICNHLRGKKYPKRMTYSANTFENFSYDFNMEVSCQT
jgi:threonine dehydrogenase-like Zn-dependent dehydrogenase